MRQKMSRNGTSGTPWRSTSPSACYPFSPCETKYPSVSVATRTKGTLQRRPIIQLIGSKSYAATVRPTQMPAGWNGRRCGGASRTGAFSEVAFSMTAMSSNHGSPTVQSSYTASQIGLCCSGIPTGRLTFAPSDCAICARIRVKFRAEMSK